ncbi:MAG: aminotransferase class I/II-fold pyridoxal phosphate-dependent enzyme [Clostridium sp.]
MNEKKEELEKRENDDKSLSSEGKDKEKHSKAPIYEALMAYKKARVVPFDVPGHKQGRGNPMLKEFLGEKCVSVDVNSMKPLDNLCHPVSVIKEAEELAADSFGAKHAFFMVNGTTSAVQAMVMSVCKKGEKIIMPRNVHRSAINALVISGAIPVYINPGVNKKLGIPLGMSVKDVEKTIKENPDAKAVLVNNPTYYGICSNLKKITELAHEHGMYVLVDEAHGTHFYFGENMPISAMAAGADMAAVSMHKTGGSLTQSSFLLLNCNLHAGYVRQIINLTQTTSGSYLLMSSLDLARRDLVLNGKEIFKKVMNLAQYARDEINKIGGYYAFSEELIDNDEVFDFDRTKLSIFTRDIGLAGIEVYDILRDEYGIQIEFGDIANILAIISVGDRELTIERLISALYEIKRIHSKNKAGMFDHEYINPEVVLTPQEAFYSAKKSVPMDKSNGKICAEFVMCYPPGIPILSPGEKITAEILDYINYAKEKGCFLTGTEDIKIENINIVEGGAC